MLRPLLLILLLTFSLAPPLQADAALHLETFKLRNRPAADLLPLIKPFLHPEGTIRGEGYRLFVQSTGANLEQIGELVSELDVPLKRLRISISTDTRHFEEQEKQQIHNHAEAVQSSSEPNVRKIIIGKGPQHRITTRVYSTVDQRRQPSAQHVQLLEGQWASINTGHAVPVADRRRNSDGTVTETITYRKVSSGFRVRAHINDDKAYLTLQSKRQKPAEGGGGVFLDQNLETSLTVPLGQWTEIGGQQRLQNDAGRGITHRTRRRQEGEQRIFIKVERIE